MEMLLDSCSIRRSQRVLVCGLRREVELRMRGAGWLTITVLCGVQFVDVLGVGTALSALPAMLEGVAAPPGSAPILATAHAALFGGLLILGAQLGDRYGHRPCWLPAPWRSRSWPW